MSQGIKDHFVPCSYLKYFATHESRKDVLDYRAWKVNAYDRIRNIELSNPSRIDSVAYSKYFEYYEDDETFNAEVRERIHQVEHTFSLVQEKIVNAQSLGLLLPEDFLALFEFVAFQRERTLARRNLYKNKLKTNLDVDAGGKVEFSKYGQELAEKQLVDKVFSIEIRFEEVLRNGTEEEIRSLFAEQGQNLGDLDLQSTANRERLLTITRDSFSRIREEANSGELFSKVAKDVHDIASDAKKLQNYHLENLFDYVGKFAKQLESCGWILWVNNTPQPFWTSDNPVVHYLIPPKMENVPESINNLLNRAKLAALLFESSNIVNLDGTINSEFCLLFPIAPNLLLQVRAYNPDAGFRLIQSKVENEWDVHTINFWQFSTTSRNLYCNEKKFEQTAQMQTEFQKLFQDFFNLSENLTQALKPFRKK